jgi:hypothetical protein
MDVANWQVWSTLTGASCLLIAGMSSFLLAGLVHPHWSVLPPHCRYVIFSCKLGPPSWASCLLIAGKSSFLAGLVHPHWSFLPPHCRYVVFSSFRFDPPSVVPPASSLQVSRLFLQVWPTLIGASCLIIAGTVRRLSMQVWSTLTGASCVLIAGMSSFLVAGLVHPHWSFLPPYCRYVDFSSCRSGPPSWGLLPPHCRYVIFPCTSGPPSQGPPASSLQVRRLFLQGYSLQDSYPPSFLALSSVYSLLIIVFSLLMIFYSLFFILSSGPEYDSTMRTLFLSQEKSPEISGVFTENFGTFGAYSRTIYVEHSFSPPLTRLVRRHPVGGGILRKVL